MKNIYIIPSIFLLTLSQLSMAQKHYSDANIVGHVVCRGKHIAFASVSLKGTTIGTSTDETGHFQLINLPEGEQIIVVTNIGYKSQEEKITIKANTTIEIKFHLEEDIMNLEEVVVSADRSEQKRTEAPVIVNTIGKQIFHITQSQTLGEVLNFSPGLRLENNCQNCGFSQVRMNGMEGPYSQILINSRPIFSGLAGVYGLELIPSNMVEKVEVVRGGGSALFGSNAIAGTINIILRDPTNSSYEGGATYALTGIGMDESAGPAADYSLNFNTSVISDDHKSGLSLYGFTRNREMFDANDDSFSELAPLKNLTFGARVFHRLSHRDKLATLERMGEKSAANGSLVLTISRQIWLELEFPALSNIRIRQFHVPFVTTLDEGLIPTLGTILSNPSAVLVFSSISSQRLEMPLPVSISDQLKKISI